MIDWVTATPNEEKQLMFKLLVPALIALAVSTGALASPGQTTTGVNLRAGPGTNFPTLQILTAGAAGRRPDCDDAGAWCAVSYKGEKGFVSGRYLQATNDNERWPRAFDIGQGRLSRSGTVARGDRFGPRARTWTRASAPHC